MNKEKEEEKSFENEIHKKKRIVKVTLAKQVKTPKPKKSKKNK